MSSENNEDCLTLNIYTPRTSKYATNPLPVIVYVHGKFSKSKGSLVVAGGSFVSGSSSENYYWGNYLVSHENNSILVTINYRLGALGFLVILFTYNI